MSDYASARKAEGERHGQARDGTPRTNQRHGVADLTRRFTRHIDEVPMSVLYIRIQALQHKGCHRREEENI